MLRFTVMESVHSPSMPTWTQQTTPLFRLWYASAYVVFAYFVVVSWEQGLSLPICLLLLDFYFICVNDRPFQRCALMITLERRWTAQSDLCGRCPFHFKRNNTWEDCAVLLENCVGRNQRASQSHFQEFSAAYCSSMLTSTCYTFQKCWLLATLWTSVVNCWQRYLNRNLMWSFASRCICI